MELVTAEAELTRPDETLLIFGIRLPLCHRIEGLICSLRDNCHLVASYGID